METSWFTVRTPSDLAPSGFELKRLDYPTAEDAAVETPGPIRGAAGKSDRCQRTMGGSDQPQAEPPDSRPGWPRDRCQGLVCCHRPAPSLPAGKRRPDHRRRARRAALRGSCSQPLLRGLEPRSRGTAGGSGFERPLRVTRLGQGSAWPCAARPARLRGDPGQAVGRLLKARSSGGPRDRPEARRRRPLRSSGRGGWSGSGRPARDAAGGGQGLPRLLRLG